MRERIINVGKVTSVLAGFGSIDVKPYGKKTALIATSSQNTADKILKQFKNDREYLIVPYNAIRHSPASQMAAWGGAFLTGGLLLYLLHKRVNK
ncbi:jg3249 [Pararge aegeria aegeria]|uniref:Jg3249 protein n=2 Tax=Pararge aegeria TaxID=116150 RepID=A0A8S4RUU5_9NEOP|nr:jg3249 [Pararge aegeria aegeria]